MKIFLIMILVLLSMNSYAKKRVVNISKRRFKIYNYTNKEIKSGKLVLELLCKNFLGRNNGKVYKKKRYEKKFQFKDDIILEIPKIKFTCQTSFFDRFIFVSANLNIELDKVGTLLDNHILKNVAFELERNFTNGLSIYNMPALNFTANINNLDQQEYRRRFGDLKNIRLKFLLKTTPQVILCNMGRFNCLRKYIYKVSYNEFGTYLQGEFIQNIGNTAPPTIVSFFGDRGENPNVWYHFAYQTLHLDRNNISEEYSCWFEKAYESRLYDMDLNFNIELQDKKTGCTYY